jgi:HEAT repeat protein
MTELATALQAKSAAVRWQAIEKLNKTTGLKSVDATTLSILVKALADEHPFVRWQAGLVLARQKAGWQKLIEVLNSNSAPTTTANTDVMRSAAIDALATEKSPEINALLIETLRTGQPLARQSAAEALAHRGNLEAVPSLTIALNDADPWVRRAAVYALGHIGDQSAVGVLIGRLTDKAVIVRRSVAYALGALRAVVAVPKLKISLVDQDPQVRRNAAWALGRIGQLEAVPALTPLLDDTTLGGTVAATARQAIDAITKPRWLQALLGLRRRFQ